MPLEHLDASTAPERVAAALERDACVVIDRLAPPETLKRLLVSVSIGLVDKLRRANVNDGLKVRADTQDRENTLRMLTRRIRKHRFSQWDTI